MGIKIGQKAPGFSLKDQDNKIVSLSDFSGKKAVVLYFYPKDDTPGCTAESCSFRDSFEDFQDAGAVVIGVSADSPESHARFAKKYHLPFRLLSDEDGAVRNSYEVARTLGLFPGRVTFVIDKEGIVRHSFSSQLRPTKHVQESLEILKGIQ